MSTFQTMLNMQLSLFAIMLVGFFCRRKNMIDTKTRGVLSDLLINVILPCNIINSFRIEVTEQLLRSMGLVFAIFMGIQFFSWALSKVAYTKVPMDQQVILRHGTITSNAGFLGNPIAQGVFGSEGLLYASIALIPVRIFLWSAGLSLYTKTDSRSVIKNLLTHPCVIAVFIGFGYMFLPFDLPGFIPRTLSSIGGCTTAVSMLVIGGILAEIDLKRIRMGLLSYYSFIRLIFIPACVFIVLKLLHVDPLLTGVSTLLSGMPSASMTAVLAAKYGRDAEFGAQVVFVSTVLSMVTIPLMTLFFD
ncbi:MAG: AEC family transporter [Ruminococcaceae bacterium]|nr:AEC family transporter [Oscillospiraceae bacterium]